MEPGYQVIMLAAGQGKRLKAGRNKQLIQLDQKPLIAHTVAVFEQDEWCEEICLVVQPQEEEVFRNLSKSYGWSKVSQFVHGGQERQDSVRNGIEALKDERITFIHDGARPFVSKQELHALYEQTRNTEAAFLAVPVTDTIKEVTEQQVKTLDRKYLYAAQTPQAFTYSLAKKIHDFAHENKFVATDDVSIAEALGIRPTVVKGSYDNFKITTPEDIQKAENMLQINKSKTEGKSASTMRIGQGFDVHELVDGRPCIIGGVEIPYEKGLLGHSDADVLLHTIADAALGAIGEGDIGKHFPDDDPEFKDADSKKLLKHVWKIVDQAGYKLGNVDCTVIAQAPKMAPYIEEIRGKVAELLNASIEQVNVKATTTEKLGFTGRKEGIAAQAVILLTDK